MQADKQHLQEIPDLENHLHHQLSLRLPGQPFQFRMAHLSRIASIPMRSDVRKAAVLVLLFQRDRLWKFVVIRRKSIDGDVHSGQISFPGGRARLNESMEEAALRESNEEIGSPLDTIGIIGQLTPLHIPVSNHLVHPVVGVLNISPEWNPQESEVDAILEIPLHRILEPDTQVIAPIQLAGGVVLQDVPCYKIQGHLIWGATAMLLSEFSAVLGR